MQRCKKAKIEKHVDSATNGMRTKVDKNAKSERIAIEVKSAKCQDCKKWKERKN